MVFVTKLIDLLVEVHANNAVAFYENTIKCQTQYTSSFQYHFNLKEIRNENVDDRSRANVL